MQNRCSILFLIIVISTCCGFVQAQSFKFNDKEGIYKFNPSGPSSSSDALEFEAIGSFKDGLCPVMKNQLWAVIDESGRYIVTPRYEYILSLAKGFFLIIHKGQYGLLDENGRIVVNPMHTTANYQNMMHGKNNENYSITFDGVLYVYNKSSDRIEKSDELFEGVFRSADETPKFFKVCHESYSDSSRRAECEVEKFQELVYYEAGISEMIDFKAVVELVISKDKTIRDLKILSISDRVYADRFIKAIKKASVHKPAKHMGVAVDYYYTLHFSTQ